jgi:RNA recognition motif-containing protein
MVIFVKNITYALTEDRVRTIFTHFGKVIQVEIIPEIPITERDQVRHAYIEMPNKTEGSEAIRQLNGKIIDGRSMTVIEALPLSNKKTKKRII